MAIRHPGHRYALLGVLLAGATVALVPREVTRAEDELQISGAYRALGFFGESRAYPARDIPSGAYSRAYEYSRRALRRPLAETGGGGPLMPGGSGDSRWEPLGPTNGGGRTLAVAFDPADPNTIWAGSAAGGLWRSTTGGVGADAWERVDTGAHPVLGVSAITFEPGDSNVMYIGTGEVYNHQAAGNWAANRATRGSYGVGILKSIDGGATWTKSLDWSYEQRHGVWAVRVDPTDPDVVWAATTDGVYKSTNAGQNWSRELAVVMATDLVVHPTNTDTVLVACGDLGSTGRGIYRTTDGGANWSQVTGGGVPADFQGKIQFGVTPADEDVVYASVGNGFSSSNAFTWLLRSTDFGASFTLRNTTDYSRWQGWYAHDVAVDPTDADNIICIGIDIWRSSNAGQSLFQRSDWTSYFTGQIPDGGPEGGSDYSHADHHDVVYHPSDPDIIYFATDGGVFRSMDGADTFEGVNGGYQTTQFYNGTVSDATNRDLIMGGLQDNASVIYGGDGKWARWVLGGDGGWCAINWQDPDIVYATAQFLFAGRSDNGGVNFSGISPPDVGGPYAFICPLLMSQTDPDVLYAGSSFLFKTVNEGSNWSVANGGSSPDGNPILVMAVAQDDDDVLYLATAPFSGRSRVHRTLNGGASVTEITGTLPDRYPGDLIVDPTDEATVYLTLSGFGTSHVFKSTDYGATWDDIDNGVLPDVPTSAVFVDPTRPDHVYVGNDLGVYLTNDEGANWTQLPVGLPEAVLVTDLNSSLSDGMLRVFTHGNGVYERPLRGLMKFRPASPPKQY